LLIAGFSTQGAADLGVPVSLYGQVNIRRTRVIMISKVMLLELRWTPALSSRRIYRWSLRFGKTRTMLMMVLTAICC